MPYVCKKFMEYVIKHVESTDELTRALDFAEFNLKCPIPGGREVWAERLKTCPELLLYAEADGEILGAALSFLEANGNVTVGPVAVAEKHRLRGIGTALLREAEKRAAKLGARLIALGSVETAEGFYRRLGYEGWLLIQSESHTVDELLALNPNRPVVFTNVYQNRINQLCLDAGDDVGGLKSLYETSLAGCSAQTMFKKTIA